jgi:short-subunit dehydrogenase
MLFDATGKEEYGMKALVTGASSGIGRDMARELSRRGYDLILVARRRERLCELQTELPTHVEILCADLSKEEECLRVFQSVDAGKVDVLVNNAGFGLFGAFEDTNLQRELELIDTNIRAVHILTKLFLREFSKRNSGYILNVSSSAAFAPGPLLGAYYASKAYVLRLTEAIAEELRRKRSGVYIGALCPGPVRTEFDEVADVHFSVRGLDSRTVARYAIEKMFARKLIIIPGALMKSVRFAERFLPEKLLLRASYHMQKRKRG